MKRSPLARKTPLRRSRIRPKARAPMKRSRLRRANPERLARLRREQFGPEAEWLMTLPCCTCGALAPSTPSHVKSRGSGGLRHEQIPQCWRCHSELEQVGVRLYALAKGLDLVAMASEYATGFEMLPASDRAMYTVKMEERIKRIAGRSNAANEGGE